MNESEFKLSAPSKSLSGSNPGSLPWKFVPIFVCAIVLVKCVLQFLRPHLFPLNWDGYIQSDFWTWLEFITKSKNGLIPYVDFSKEYPPLVGWFYWLLALTLSSEPRQLMNQHAYLMIFFEGVNTALFAFILREHGIRNVLWGLLLFQFNLTNLFLIPYRFDSLLILSVLSGYLLHLKKRHYWAAAVWGVGFNIKWFTGFIILANLVLAFRKSVPAKTLVKQFALFTFVAILPNVVLGTLQWLKSGSYQHVLLPFNYHMNRPLYWDTVLGVYSIWLGEVSFERLADKLSLGLMLASIFLCIHATLKEKIILICIAMLLLNRAYSAQFHLWFYPFLLLIALDTTEIAKRSVYLIAFLSLDVLNVLVYPVFFSQALREVSTFSPGIAVLKGATGTIWFSLAVVARALVLGFLGIAIIKQFLTRT